MAPAGSQALPGGLWDDQHREGTEVTATLETVETGQGMSPRPCGEDPGSWQEVRGTLGIFNENTHYRGQCRKTTLTK